jgi:hypothetical protein
VRGSFCYYGSDMAGGLSVQSGDASRPATLRICRLGVAAAVFLGAGALVLAPSSTASAASSFSVVQQGSATLAGSVGSVSVVLGSGARAGDLLVATGGVFPAAASVTAPSGFVLAGSTVGASGSGGAGGAVVWSKVAVGGESSFTFGQPASSGNYSQFSVFEISGLGSSVAVDGVPAWQSSASSVTGYSQTYGSAPVAAGELGFAFFVTRNATAQVTPAGWSLIAGPTASNNDMGYYLESVGSVAPSVTTSGLTPSGGYTAGIVVFRNAG